MNPVSAIELVLMDEKMDDYVSLEASEKVKG